MGIETEKHPKSRIANHQTFVLLLLVVVLSIKDFTQCSPAIEPIAPPPKSNTTRPSLSNSPKPNHNVSAIAGHGHHIQGIYMLDPSERFCRNHPKRPFYQRASDGAVCCRGRQLPIVSIVPETTGECALATKTDVDGMLDSENLVSYSNIPASLLILLCEVI